MTGGTDEPLHAAPKRRDSDDKERARRERKRETDRKSQRIVRDRKRARVEQLERLVHDLTASASTPGAAPGNSVSDLTRRLRDQQEQILALQNALQKIVGVAQTAGSEATAQASPGAASSAASVGTPPPLQASSQQRQACSSPAPAAFLGYSLDGETDLDRNLFRIMSHMLGYIETQGILACASHSVTFDEDMIVRILVHGWDSVQEKHPELDLGWKYLRALDAGMLSVVGQVERAVGMYLSRLVMRSKASILDQGTQVTLPTFMNKSAVQQSFPYDSIVDYFAWPSFRDKLILMGVQNIPARDVVDYLASTRFFWPYEFRDIYMKSVPSGEYRFSEAFKKHFHDLRCWRLTAAFVSRFPGLHDIPTDGEVSLAGAPGSLQQQDPDLLFDADLSLASYPGPVP